MKLKVVRGTTNPGGPVATVAVFGDAQAPVKPDETLSVTVTEGGSESVEFTVDAADCNNAWELLCKLAKSVDSLECTSVSPTVNSRTRMALNFRASHVPVTVAA